MSTPAADVHHLSALPAAFALLKLKKPSSSFQGRLCATLRGWVTLGTGFSPSFPALFPITSAGGGRTALTTATDVQHSASPNLLPACSRQGTGNEVPQGPCEKGRLWKRAGAFPLPAPLRAWAAGQSSPSVSCDLPSPMPEFSRTPQENHMAEERVRASSSSSSLFTLKRPNGLEDDTEPFSFPLLIPLSLIPRAPHCALCVLVQPCVTHSYRLCLVPSSSSHFLAHPCADLQPCLAHAGAGPITLSPDQKAHLTPGQLTAAQRAPWRLAIKASGHRAEAGTGSLALRGAATGLRKAKRKFCQSPEADSPLGQVSYSTWSSRCVPTSPRAGYPTYPYPLA